MARAIHANAPYIRASLKRPFLPDCPAARPSNAPLLGQQSDIIAGCRVVVGITRACPVLTPASHAALLAACSGSASQAALCAAALGCADLGRLLGAGSSGGWEGLRVQGRATPLLPLVGQHFFDSPEAAVGSLSAAEAEAGGLPVEWRAQ